MALDTAKMQNAYGLHGFFRCEQVVPVDKSWFIGLNPRFTMLPADISLLHVALKAAFEIP
jgi:hypothetical protein